MLYIDYIESRILLERARRAYAELRQHSVALLRTFEILRTIAMKFIECTDTYKRWFDLVCVFTVGLMILLAYETLVCLPLFGVETF